MGVLDPPGLPLAFADARYVRMVNGESPDTNWNVFVSGEGVADSNLADMVVAGETKTALDAVYAPVSLSARVADIAPDGGVRAVGKGDLLASVKDFGAIGDGITDDAPAFVAAFNSGLPLYVPRGDYRLASTITRNFSGLHMVGQSGARVFSDTVDQLFRFSSTDGVHIENISFECAVADAANSNYGLLSSTSSLKNILLYRCVFTAANRNTNGVKFIADNLAELSVENVFARECVFRNIGRMGMEIQDHSVDRTIVRVKNVGVIDCAFQDCGTLSTGIDLSFSGHLCGAVARGNTLIRSATIGVEFAGDHEMPVAVGNTFSSMGPSCNAISFTNNYNSNQVIGAVIEGNRSIDRSGSGSRLWYLYNARLSRNYFKFASGAMVLRSCVRTVAYGETYDSSGAYALFIEGTSTDNVFERCELRTGTGAFSIFRVNGADSVRNYVVRSNLIRSVGVTFDQINSSTQNAIIQCDHGSTRWQPVKTITIADADKTINVVEADSEALIFSGTLTAARTVTLQNAKRAYRLKNNTAQQVSVTTGGTAVAIAAGATKIVYVEGTTITEV